MKVFTLRADCTFEAKSIDDALERLSAHFLSLIEGEDDNGSRALDMQTGHISVAPLTVSSFASFCVNLANQDEAKPGAPAVRFHGVPDK